MMTELEKFGLGACLSIPDIHSHTEKNLPELRKTIMKAFTFKNMNKDQNIVFITFTRKILRNILKHPASCLYLTSFNMHYLIQGECIA